MCKASKRHFLKEREVKQLLEEFSGKTRMNAERFFGIKPNIELVEAGTMSVFIFNGKPLLTKSGGLLFPTLVFNEFFAVAPKIIVDMGAVPHVCNGADVMAPGMVQVNGEFNVGDIVVIVDEQHGKPLSIGIALYDSTTMKGVKHGKVVKNIHFVGDELWNILKKF